MTTIQNELLVILISAMPVGELRAGIPVGLGLGLDPRLVLGLAILGNLAPVLPILFLLEPISKWLMDHSRFFQRFLSALFERTRVKHTDKIERYGAVALIAFVAIPSPGTGAWTGSLVAWLFGIELIYAIPAIVFGVCLAGAIVFSVSTGAVTVFRFFESPVVSVGLLLLLALLIVAVARYRNKSKQRSE